MPMTTSSFRRPSRRRWMAAVAAAAGLAAAGGAWAQAGASAWPSKPVRLVVAFPAGGLADVMSRTLAPQLAEALGQPVVIDNRGGASGNLAAQELIRTGGDHHTFMVNVTTLESVNPLLYGTRLGFDPTKEFRHVALLANTQLFLITRPNFPASNLKEFVAYARSNPGKLSYGSAGNGTTPHIGGELFKQTAGIQATHAPYRGAAPAIQDVMAGQIDFAFAPGTVFSSVKAGRLKLLAVASRQRTQNYPEAPTVDELGFGRVFVDTPFAVYAPAGMPDDHVMRMNREINRLLGQAAIKARFAELGADAQPLSPNEVKALVKAESEVFGPVIKAGGIQVD